MSKMKVLRICLCLLYFMNHAMSQSDIPIGIWKSHLSFKEGIWITQSEDYIIYAASRGIFYIGKEDGEITYLSRENGLTGIQVSKMAYDGFNRQLIIVYADSNIDILSDEGVINVPAIRDNRVIPGSKKVNDVEIANAATAFLATDFGILSFDLQKLEFKNTTFTPVPVKDIAIFNGRVFGATSEGLYNLPINDPNPADFGRWKKLKMDSELPENYNAAFVQQYKNRLFLVIENSILYCTDDLKFELWQEELPGHQIRFLSAQGKYLLIGQRGLNDRSKIWYTDENLILNEGGADCINRLIYGIEDQKGRIWYADEWSPVRYTDTPASGCRKLDFNSPASNTAGEIHFLKDTAFIASGGITEDYQNPAVSFGYYIYAEKEWKNFNRDNNPVLGEKDFLYIQTMVPEPKTSSLFLGSFWNGILKYNRESGISTHYNTESTGGILQRRTGDPLRIRIPYLRFDRQGNMWVCNFGAPRPLVVKTKDDKWYNFSVPGSTNLSKIDIDAFENKWITVQGVGNGLLVFNEGKDLENTSDDQIRYFTTATSAITGNKVNCVAVDLGGSVWVGTSEGPVVFDCADPFDTGRCKGNTKKVIEDGIPAILLKAEEILSIAVDGGNKKWLGTRNGIFVVAPSGDTVLYSFNTRNSPLVDNTIKQLAFNGESGEMWISTNAGIQSFRTATSTAARTYTDVYAFPNPVRPDYQGDIAIRGLARDVQVKIVDMSGRLVYETNAEGGTAIWNGKDYNGVPVTSGTYLVFASTTDITVKADTYVTKVLIIR